MKNAHTFFNFNVSAILTEESKIVFAGFKICCEADSTEGTSGRKMIASWNSMAFLLPKYVFCLNFWASVRHFHIDWSDQRWIIYVRWLFQNYTLYGIRCKLYINHVHFEIEELVALALRHSTIKASSKNGCRHTKFLRIRWWFVFRNILQVSWWREEQCAIDEVIRTPIHFVEIAWFSYLIF